MGTSLVQWLGICLAMQVTSSSPVGGSKMPQAAEQPRPHTALPSTCASSQPVCRRKAPTRSNEDSPMPQLRPYAAKLTGNRLHCRQRYVSHSKLRLTSEVTLWILRLATSAGQHSPLIQTFTMFQAKQQLSFL